MNNSNKQSEREQDWFDKALAQHDYEITGTPKHWKDTDEKKAADAKLKAVVQAEVLKARIDSLQSLKRIHDAGDTDASGRDWWSYVEERIAELQAQASKKGMGDD